MLRNYAWNATHSTVSTVGVGVEASKKIRSRFWASNSWRLLKLTLIMVDCMPRFDPTRAEDSHGPGLQ